GGGVGKQLRPGGASVGSPSRWTGPRKTRFHPGHRERSDGLVDRPRMSDDETRSEALERLFEETAAWAPYVTSVILGIVVVHLLRERPSVDRRPSVGQLGRATEHAAYARGSDGHPPPGAQPQAEPGLAMQIDPRKFLHTPEDCPLTGCSRCTR
ncbi:hypothetical protein T492DRAFT_332708, partial [Pavlovales sp. CCMP2436]